VARLPYVDPESAPKRVRTALERVPPLNVFRMMANAETAFRPWLAFGGALLSSLELDARLRELAILRVARLSGAEYEWVQHAPIALAEGSSREQVDAVDRYELDHESLADVDRAVLRFTTSVVEDVRASDETFAVVREHLSPREVVELLLVIGQYMTVARVARTADIELDGPPERLVSDSAAARPGV
jgi:alkylhydroperoxidase family enzyme